MRFLISLNFCTENCEKTQLFIINIAPWFSCQKNIFIIYNVKMVSFSKPWLHKKVIKIHGVYTGYPLYIVIDSTVYNLYTYRPPTACFLHSQKTFLYKHIVEAEIFTRVSFHSKITRVYVAFKITLKNFFEWNSVMRNLSIV